MQNIIAQTKNKTYYIKLKRKNWPSIINWIHKTNICVTIHAYMYAWKNTLPTYKLIIKNSTNKVYLTNETCLISFYMEPIHIFYIY